MTADVEVRCAVATTNRLGETPLWCPVTRSVWWIDIEEPKLQQFTPTTGAYRSFALPGPNAGSLAFHAAGGFVVAIGATLHGFDPDTGTLAAVVTVEPDDRDTRLNDGRCDARGRLWIGTMDNGLTRPTGALYRIDPDGSATRMVDDVIVSNGTALSPDGKTLYFADTRRFVLWAFDLDIDRGTLSNRRIFADHRDRRERPDGACVDAEGFVWSAIFAGGRVIRHAPDGRIDREIRLPVTNPTCLCFGGSDLRTLYISTARKFLTEAELAGEPLAGALLSVELDVEGVAEHRFGQA